jgi:hypothetical protein
VLRRRALVPATGLLLAGLALTGLPSEAASPLSAHLNRPVVGPEAGGFPGAEVALGDADRRGPVLAPLKAARAHLATLGKGLEVSWTQYGTPLNLTRERDFLATGLVGSPEQVARTFLKRNAALWGLSAADVDALVVVVNQPLSQGSDAYTVSFNQVVNGMLVAEDGYVVVGVRGDKVAIVTSSLVPAAVLGRTPSAAPRMPVAKAVLAATKDAGVTNLRVADLKVGDVDHAGFTHVTTTLLNQPQRARLRMLPTTDRGARLVWEVDVLDVADGRALATMSYVDDLTGDVLLRRDAVDTFAEGMGLRSFDNPNAPAGPVLTGAETGPATWRGYGSNPQLAKDGKVSKDDRYLACSGRDGAANLLQKNLLGCSFLYNDGSPLPYDVDPIAGVPTFTTIGNNAVTTNAQASSSLTPGAPFLPPVSPTRDYAPAFTDSWHTSVCDPASLVLPARADVDAAIVNLFLGHNRVHDFSYRLGLNEARGAMQVSNFGKTSPAVENDPEIGNAQNGALQGGSGLGRDNANQITLQDGVPGITNQYLFQPLVGFYSPCTDGDLDGAVFLHEYTHAVSNRLIAGPATGLSGFQGGSMGESWSDLTAIEYLNAFGLAGTRGEHPYSMGAYVTGDSFRGIRDFNALPENNPLNYSDIGFDTTGPEVHADGEVWNAIQMEIRQALIKKYDRQYPYNNRELQIACAVGRTKDGARGPAWNKCPGNRRYITYQYDAMALQANGAPSMVDMRNAELAAILLRDKKDYDVVYDAFAVRGLGKGAESVGSADTDPTPSFASPVNAKNGTVTFKLVDARTGKPVKGSVYVGEFSARCMPVASTLGEDEVPPTARMMKGRYRLTVQADGYGIQRFTTEVKPGSSTKVLKLQQNVASARFGAGIKGNAGGLRLGRIIDDTEESNGAFDGQPVKGRTVTVTFGTGRTTFDKIAVSSLHHAAKTLPEGGTEIEGRLLGIRAFDLQVSNDGGKTFRTFYKSADNFFPADRPRAVAPDLMLRTIKLKQAVTGNAIRMVIRSNTCTGGNDFNYEQENDRTTASDCRSTATNTTQVTITELQVFRSR